MDLVVAVYNENIDWVHEITAKRVFLYLKNSNRFEEISKKFPYANVEILENIGRESHTYLHHICEHYNDLGDYTFFLQGHPFDHCEKDRLLRVMKNPNSTITLFGTFYKCDGNGFPHHSGLPLTKLYSEYFGKTQEEFNFVAGAQFIVSSDLIIRNTLDKYKFLLKKHYIEPILPWCMERYWIYLFT